MSEAEQISEASERSENESLNLEPEITDFVRLPDTDHATSSALNGPEDAAQASQRFGHALPVVSVLDERWDGNYARSNWWKEWWEW